MALIDAMSIPVRDLLRRKGTPYDELGLDDPKFSDDELIDLMLAHPILINRPIVETPLGTRLCRPSEAVLDILPDSAARRIPQGGWRACGRRRGAPGGSWRERRTVSSHAPTAEAVAAPPAGIGFFEKWLSVWVAICIGAGLLLGNTLPGLFETLAGLEIASVNLVVAVLIWAMVYPMMVAVDFASLRHIGDRPKGLVLTLVVNWLIKPFTMAGLAVLFFEVLFADLIAPADAQQYIAGLILLGAAPCTAMVFVWSQLTRGDPTYTLVQVSVNDVIMIFAFAPIVALLLGVTDIAVPWETLILSVGLYILIPLAAGAVTRQWLARTSRGEDAEAAVARFTAAVKPFSVIGLLATVVLLFGFQGQIILRAAAADRADRRSAAHPVLRHLCARLCSGLGLARAVQRRGALRADRYIELLRARGGSRNQPLRPAVWCRARNGGRRSRRGPGDAVARRLRQPDAASLSGGCRSQTAGLTTLS